MPSICLNADEVNYDTYRTEEKKITVSKHSFNESNLFVFSKHTPEETLKVDDIYAYKLGGNNPGSITIKKDADYENNFISYAHVYFNKYDDKYQYPLILLLFFTDDTKASNRYYKISKFDKDKTSELKISDLCKYVDGKELFNELLNENEKLTCFLTYDIGMSKKVNSDRYNNNKIIISHKQEVFRKYRFNGDGFYKYTHTPYAVNKADQYKSLITYNNSLLKKHLGDKTSDLEEIQAKNYQCVNVYFGSKAKVKGINSITEDNVPLMVELVRLDRPKYCEYYCHHQNNKDLYWEKLEVSNYEKYTGTKIKGLVDPTNLTINHQMFLKILKRLEFYFLQTLVVMINKQKSYKKVNVVESYIDYGKSTIINEDSDLPVTETTQQMNCLQNTGFKVFEHDLRYFESKHEDYQIKCIIPTIDIMGKYNEITLYSSKNSRSENIENLSFCQNGYGANKIQVYFYDMDPRPLLVSFGEKAYKPKNKDKYSTEWVRIEDFDDYLEDNGSSLLKQLFEVIGFLNEVNIYEHSDYSYQNRDYEIQTYDNSKKCITVSRSHLDCYIKYEHKPKINQGYRLGNIVYKKDNKEKGRISYNYSTPLVQVNVYYYNNDTKREYPLLVELEFKNNGDDSNIRTKEHYKLLKSDFNDIKWTVDYHARQVVDESKNLISYLDFVKNSFNYVEELKGFNSYCNHNHSANSTFPGISYITPSHITDEPLHDPSSSYTGHNRSHSTNVRSPTRGGVHITNNQNVIQTGPKQEHSHQAPYESRVEKATRIASTVGTFAIAGTGTGVAIYKYSRWIINLFKRLF